MGLGALCLILAAIFVWGMFSARATAISTPIFFVATGVVMSQGLKPLQLELDPHLIKVVAEVTLVWVLFADASRVRIADLRADKGRYLRLLGLGLPLTIALGALAAAVVLGVSPWYALLVGAALAPTDAALGSAVMSDRRVPRRVRQTLNVESGLNDGIATPVVLLALAGIAAAAGQDHEGPGDALVGLLLGVAVGLVVGAGGGALLRIALRRGWSSDEFAGPAVLALALLAYLGAVAIGANGFVAAFVGGGAYGAFAGRAGMKEVYYVEQTCGLASMISWFVFGAVIIPALAAGWTWHILVYAVLSLTVVRMLPVAISLLGSGHGPGHCALHRLVRASRTGIDRLRAHCSRGPARRSGSDRRGGRRHRSHRAPQRACPRTQRTTPRRSVRRHPRCRPGRVAASRAGRSAARQPAVGKA